MQRSLRKYFPIFVLPTFLAFFLGFMVPFFMGIYLSFCNFRTVVDAKWVGFVNYTRMFTANSEFGNALWFTVRYAIVSIITINIFAFLLATALTKGRPGTNLFRTVFFMPNLVGGIVLGYIWQIIFNGVLGQFGYTLTTDAKYGFWGLIILMNWQMIGYMMVIYIAGIQGIPKDLMESASIDGANSFQVLRHVTIPMVMPAVTICVFLTLSNSFKLFDQNLALTRGAPANQTSMLALDIFNTFYNRVGWAGVAQAKAVVFFILVAVIALTQVILTRRREVEV